MKNFNQNNIFIINPFFPFEKKLLASDIYFIDYSRVMNESTAGKKAQDNLKNLLKNSNKKFEETAKKLKSEENKIIKSKKCFIERGIQKKLML